MNMGNCSIKMPPTSRSISSLNRADDSNPAPDHYTILGISPTASIFEIKTAYRALCVEYFHSDVEKYRAVQEAYIMLTDSEKRREYDSTLPTYNRVCGLAPQADMNQKGNHTRCEANVVSPIAKMVSEAGQEVCNSASRIVSHRALQLTLSLDADVSDDSTASTFGRAIYDESGLLCESPTSMSCSSEPMLKTQVFHPGPSRIPMLKGYGRRARHSKLLCARPRHLRH
jgi:hypothetical protein